MKSKWIRALWNWGGSITVALVVSLLVSIFIIQPTRVEGHSMEPTLQNNNRIYVAKWGHLLQTKPDYGDIVIIDSRVDRHRTIKDDLVEFPLFRLFARNKDKNIWVKRVIGKGGDVMEIKNGEVYRNGVALKEPYIKENMLNVPDQIVTVPKGYLFVMGDNRNHSRDSRSIGSVPLDHVLGTKL
ncbi:signal peptidase I [Gorillibacterium massiliense]|uniref:signal peptidase I n=1 Tax=Gorillibacterium massiliense TaxID=1280390 RepID=UPI00059259C1|nr:signal peptidase I [Gorillibacterium massiliense]